jgi:hypothetical protein
MAVVVEVDEDVSAIGLPFADPVRPPAKVLIRVGPGIEVVVVRPVQAQVDEGCGGFQNARQVRAAHDAVRGTVVGQQGIHVRVVPARVPEFDGYPDPSR